jgi:2-dehydro-3-deoxy-L-rhamnonate dehydrogenase (NAD+)
MDVSARRPVRAHIAVVTGGEGGLGRVILAKLRSAGAQAVSLDLGPGAPTAGERVFVPCDVTREDSVAQALDLVRRRFGHIDVLVANAGVQGPVAPAHEVSAEEWRRTLDVNLTGAFLCAKAVVPGMVARGFGRIIFMSSVQGKEGTAHAGPYAASKAALIALAKVMGKELAATGVTVNCIAPTVVDAGMYHGLDAERRRELMAKIPMGRPCSAQEVAEMVAFVASERCSFSTGAVFDLSGGRATW